MRVYIGWDERDAEAFAVAEKSLRDHASIDVEIMPLVDRWVRKQGIYTRTYHTVHDHVTSTLQKIDDSDGLAFSNEFSFLRFAVPRLENYGSEWVLFTDPDVLWRGDIAGLVAQIDPDKAVCCVKHHHEPAEAYKMDGVAQNLYPRKNWSSVMAIKPDRCKMLDVFTINNSTGRWLHSLVWAGSDEQIGGLGEEWNWLAGYSSPEIDPYLVHFTSGTPDFEGHENEPFADEWRAVLNNQAVKAA